MKKMASVAMLTLLLIGMLALAFNIQPAKSETETIIVPDDYPTIQEAINHANIGDTIFVRNGTYYENVVVNKTVSLLGENKHSTIVDGNLVGNVYNITASNVTISEFTISNGYPWGLAIYGENSTISNCIITRHGIYLNSNRNKIIGNLIDRFHEVAMVWEYSHNNIIVGNTVSNWWGGSRSSTTLRLHYSNCSLLYHNNFINVTWYWRFATIASYDNLWDNGCEGNYWDDYGGVDSNGDGIGDTPYYIPYIYPDDNYPLMNPYWSSADVNHDLNVDILDVVTITSAYATTPSSPEWNPHADIAEPYGIIDIFDVVTCTINYGKEYQ